MKIILAAALAVVAAATADAQACNKPPATTGTQFYIEPAQSSARDTVLVARLCLAPGAQGLGSYMASMTYDSTKMRVVMIQTTGGMQVANSRVRGLIRIAGASPSGFAKGALAVLTFSRDAATLGSLGLTVQEASAPSGASLTGETRATGWPVKARD